jgi:hypothetical protein
MANEQIATMKVLEAVIEASREVRQVLRQGETVYLRFLRRIEKGATVDEAFAGLGVPEFRREITDHLKALEHARHETRRAIIAYGLSEGMSRGDLARYWGVSRQLVARTAKGE